MDVRPKEIIKFWEKAGPEKWFKKDAAFDEHIRTHFLTAVETALSGEIDFWADAADGALALLLLLDQFPRNIWRDDVRAFSGDDKALQIADAVVRAGFDLAMPEARRHWLYMPYMHSEDLEAQKRGMVYFAERLDDPGTLKFAHLHLDIIEKFGRFPHRNAVMGRETSDEEQRFLDEGGFKG